jgi:hypothetical protein
MIIYGYIISFFFIKTKLATECTNRTIMIIGKKSNAYVIRRGKLIYVNNLKTEVFNIHIYTRKNNHNRNNFYITNNYFGILEERKKNQVEQTFDVDHFLF